MHILVIIDRDPSRPLRIPSFYGSGNFIRIFLKSPKKPRAQFCLGCRLGA